MKIKWKEALQLAAVYVGSVVGAGFATGKEIVEFFSRFGTLGLLMIIVSGIFFIWFGVKIMLLALRLKATSYHQLNEHLFGKLLTPFVNLMMLIMLIGVTAVMLSGAGSVFEEQLALPRSIGIIGTIMLALVILVIGTRGLFIVNSLIVPLLIIFCLLLFGHVLFLPDFYTNAFKPVEWQSRALLSSVSYASFNLALTQAVLVPAAREIGDTRTIKMGGVIGGIILTLLLIMNHLVVVQLPGFQFYDIPLAVMMKKMAGTVHILFLLVIYGEIFSSIIANIYGLERFIKKILPIRTLYIGIMIFALAFVISSVNYSVLLATLYPLFGNIAFIYFLLLLIK